MKGVIMKRVIMKRVIMKGVIMKWVMKWVIIEWVRMKIHLSYFTPSPGLGLLAPKSCYYETTAIGISPVE